MQYRYMPSFFVLFVFFAYSDTIDAEVVAFFAPGGCDVSDTDCVPTKAPASQEIQRPVQHLHYWCSTYIALLTDLTHLPSVLFGVNMMAA